MSTKPPPLPFPTVPVSTPLPDDGSDSKVSIPWLNFFHLLETRRTFGPYANDAAAAAAGVPVGQQYFQPNGTVMVRLV